MAFELAKTVKGVNASAPADRIISLALPALLILSALTNIVLLIDRQSPTFTSGSPQVG
jgi:hypothetical protein